MAATKAICFDKPAQPDDFAVRLPRFRLTPDLFPLWRYACLPTVSGLHQEAQP
jgi:hypothetical protein